MNLDGRIDMDDLGPLVESLRDVRAYEAIYEVPPALAGDMDDDGDLDFDDLGSLSSLLVGNLTAVVSANAENTGEPTDRGPRTRREPASRFNRRLRF